jgi:hypothetical protein
LTGSESRSSTRSVAFSSRSRCGFCFQSRRFFPKPDGKVWYDDQRDVHRQIFEGDETVDYAFMGDDPSAAENRWLREAYENRIPIIYFLGIAPGRYQAILPSFIVGWNGKALKAQVAFGIPDEGRLVIAVAFVIMCLGILIGGHLYGRYLASFYSPGRDDTIAELRARAQKQTKIDSM